MDFFTPFQIAAQLIWSFDPELFGIISLSLIVSLVALFLSLVIGLPTGALLASFHFRGRTAVIIVSNTFLAMPPVVIGLIVYIMVSRSGPLGFMGILYTPAAMMVAQTILILPISIALSRQVFEALNTEYAPLFGSLGISKFKQMLTLIVEARIALVTIALACFGRAISEVGAVMIVGGNIRHSTRVMTTAIGLETSKGELATAMALGIVLLVIALAVNIGSQLLRQHLSRSIEDV